MRPFGGEISNKMFDWHTLSTFYTLDIVGRGSETHRQVVEDINNSTWCFMG